MKLSWDFDVLFSAEPGALSGLLPEFCVSEQEERRKREKQRKTRRPGTRFFLLPRGFRMEFILSHKYFFSKPNSLCLTAGSFLLELKTNLDETKIIFLLFEF